MKKNKIYFITFFIMHLLFIGSKSYAQDLTKVNDVIKSVSVEMYENPEKVIAVGKDILKNAGDNVEIKIKAYKLIADGYSSKRDYQKSLEYVIKANQLLPQTEDKLLKISIATKLGIQYHQLKIYDKTIQYLDQAEKLCLDYPIKDSIKISLGTNYIVRGFVYKEKLNCDIAITFFDKGINEILSSKDSKSNCSKLSIAKYNKGNCYILLSNNDLAIKSFLESIEYAKKENALSLQAFAQKGLAQVYTLEGRYKEAISLLDDARKISSNVNDLVLNQEIYKGLSENYLAINEWDKYKSYHLEYLKTQSKLKESERESISDLISEKEKEVNKNIKNEFSNFVFIFIIISAVIVLIIFITAIKKSKVVTLKLQEEINNLQSESKLQ